MKPLISQADGNKTVASSEVVNDLKDHRETTKTVSACSGDMGNHNTVPTEIVNDVSVEHSPKVDVDPNSSATESNQNEICTSAELSASRIDSGDCSNSADTLKHSEAMKGDVHGDTTSVTEEKNMSNEFIKKPGEPQSCTSSKPGQPQSYTSSDKPRMKESEEISNEFKCKKSENISKDDKSDCESDDSTSSKATVINFSNVRLVQNEKQEFYNNESARRNEDTLCIVASNESSDIAPKYCEQSRDESQGNERQKNITETNHVLKQPEELDPTTEVILKSSVNKCNVQGISEYMIDVSKRTKLADQPQQFDESRKINVETDDVSNKNVEEISEDVSNCEHMSKHSTIEKNEDKGVEQFESVDKELNVLNTDTECINEQSVDKIIATSFINSNVPSTSESGTNKNEYISGSSKIADQMALEDLQQKRSLSWTESPIKEYGKLSSPGISPIKKSPIFIRGAFPRIVLRAKSGVKPKRLDKQLSKEKTVRKEKTPIKKARAINKKVAVLDITGKAVKCDNTKLLKIEKYNMKLKRANICLVKVDSMLPRYNLHMPNLHSSTPVSNRFEESIPLPCFEDVSSISMDKTDASSKRKKVTKKLSQSRYKMDNSVCNGQIKGKVLRSNLGNANKLREKKDRTLHSLEAMPSVKMSDSTQDNRVDLDTADVLIKNDCGLDTKETKSDLKKRPKKQAICKHAALYEVGTKIAKVHILKLSGAILLKYGYDPKTLRVVPCPSTRNTSTVKLVTDEIDSFQEDALDSNTNQVIASVSNGNCSKQDVVCPTVANHSLKGDTHSVTKTTRKNKSVMKKGIKGFAQRSIVSSSDNSPNVKPVRVNLKRMNTTAVSQHGILLNSSCNLSVAESVTREKYEMEKGPTGVNSPKRQKHGKESQRARKRAPKRRN